MFWANPPLLKLILLWANVGAALLAMVFLSLEFFISKNWARRIPAIVALILAVTAVAAWLLRQGTPLAAECGLLAVFYLGAWAISLESVRQHLNRWFTPKVIWGSVLLVSLLASRWLAAHLVTATDNLHPATVVDFRDAPVNDVYAMTDQGRVVTLFHYEMLTSAEQTEAAILAEEQYRHDVIRLSQVNPAGNCHGWVFTAGRYGIRNPDLPLILKDNGYAEVEQVREGDLAIYTNNNQVTHSGLVRYVNPDGKIVIESKWGPFGTFLHPMQSQPFSGICRFYRSERQGHALALHSQSPTDTGGLRAAAAKRFETFLETSHDAQNALH